MEEAYIRIGFMENKIRDLERQLSPPTAKGEVEETHERTAYEEQMKVLQEDFLQERSDREQAIGRAEGLQAQLNVVKLEYNKLNCKWSALRNMYRALHNRAFGVDPDISTPPRIQCDYGGDVSQRSE